MSDLAHSRRDSGSLSRRLRFLGKAERGRAGDGKPTGESVAPGRPGSGPPQRPSRHPTDVESRGVPRAPKTLRGWERIGELTWRRILRGDNPVDGQVFSEILLPAGFSPADMLFFDTETTGLSGGAGNYVFLFGSAHFEGRELVAEQLFLADFPGEEDFLKALSRRLENHRLFLSYNGRAFDAPLLKTRFVLNHMPFALERQEDLLFWARRLWRRTLTDCSLGSVERGILGIRRAADVSGWEVPGIYLRYLAGDEDDRLSMVMEHNLQDVRTLARLYAHLNRLLSDGELPADTDGATLGGFLLRSGHHRGEAILQDCLSTGDERAGRALSLHYKRLGEWQRAVDLWQNMAGVQSMFAAVELAKYHEHRLREPPVALGWVDRIESWGLRLSSEQSRELDRRRKRLHRKCASLAGDSQTPAALQGRRSKLPADRVPPPNPAGTAPSGFANRVRAFRELSDRRRTREGPRRGSGGDSVRPVEGRD